MAVSTWRRVYDDLLDRYGRKVADAFMRAVDDLRSAAEVQRLIDAIARRDYEAAIDALHLEAEAFDEMLEAVRESYIEGGRAGAGRIRGRALVVRFDGRNLEAERWLRDHSARLVTRILDDQREAVRAHLSEAMAEGVNPRQTALRIVGRISRVTGRREGGVLGLTAAQERYVAAARTELASGDPEAMRAFLRRERRDRRFDRAIERAIREERPLDGETALRALTAYERRLLQLRGETIARVETMTAIQTARMEAYRQAVASGKVAEQDIIRTWRSAGDFRVRHTHRVMNGQQVRGLREPFVSPSGARLRHPMDTSLGAGMAEIANCRCDMEVRIDFIGRMRRLEREG